MKDITQYSDDELSLIVFNTESLYNSLGTDEFWLTIAQTFKYTATQLRVLNNDILEVS